MKSKLKKIPLLKSIYTYCKKVLSVFSFLYDYRFYVINSIGPKSNINKIRYEILLIVHSLEKGMTNENPRPFGKEKIYDLCKLIDKYYSKSKEACFETNIAINLLREYVNFYQENKFTNNIEYIDVKEFLKNYTFIENIDVSDKHINLKDVSTNVNYNAFLKSRHSIRNYSDKKLSIDVIKKAVDTALYSPSACNRQMCKIYYIENEKNKEIVKLYGHGFGNFNLKNANFFIITFDMSSMYMEGERNQGWLNVGIFATNFINSLHSLGVGSCMIEFGNSNKDEKKIKKILNIGKSERIGIIISSGYYLEDNVIPSSKRKDLNDIFLIR